MGGREREELPLPLVVSSQLISYPFLSSLLLLSSNLNVITGDVMNEFILVNYTRSHNDHHL